MSPEEMDELNMTFLNACDSGDIDGVRNALKSGADIHYEDNLGLIYASRQNHFEIVKYLLTSPELKERLSPKTNNGAAYLEACANGNLEMVKYLLSSPELKEHADPLSCYGDGFEKAVFNGHMDIILYLARDHKILESEPVQQYFSRNPDCEAEIKKLMKG